MTAAKRQDIASTAAWSESGMNQIANTLKEERLRAKTVRCKVKLNTVLLCTVYIGAETLLIYIAT